MILLMFCILSPLGDELKFAISIYTSTYAFWGIIGIIAAIRTFISNTVTR